MHARRLPRLNSEPFHREDYDKSSLGKGKFRTYSHRSESPDSEGANSMYSEGLSRSKDFKYRKSKGRDDRNDRNRDRSPREKYYKDKTRDKEVERLTNFGDWSEHKSSSGKRYYYNCNTEVSQWEKPREWLDYERNLSRQNYHEKRSNNDWTDRGGGGGGCVGEGRSGGVGDSRGDGRTEVRGGEENCRPNPAKIHCDRSLRGSQDNKHNSCSPQHLSRGRSHTDRSGDATPTSEGEGGNSREGGGGVNSHNNSHYTHHPGGAVSLSAVIPRISSQHSTGVNRERWDSPRSNVSQSPPSTSSEQTLPQAVMSPLQQLQTPVVTLTPFLAKLYKEELIGHVQNWPAEQLERGCHRLEEEAHQISSHGITKVSAELKMARSLVRLAEIQATLQEQRILFLRQQMLDMSRHQPSIQQSNNTDTILLPDSTDNPN